MTESTNDPRRTLFVLAGYRASGKTVALRTANKRDDFTLFRPSSMPDFKRILKSPNAPSSNSGFHSLKKLDEQRLRQDQVVGIHNDLLLPPQKLINEQLVQRYSRSVWNERTPEMFTELIRENIDSGFLLDCVRQRALQILKISSAFDIAEFSFIQSNWEINRKDWLERTVGKTGRALDELRSEPKYSFNLSVFQDDPALGQELYQLIHQAWYEILNQSGFNYMIVDRSVSHYDFREVVPSTS